MTPEELLAAAREAAGYAYAPYSRFAVVSPYAAPCFPCGACRQVLREFHCQQVLVDEGGGVRSHRLVDLLPHAFGPQDLP